MSVKLKDPVKVYKNSETDRFEDVMLTVAMEYGNIPNSEIAELVDIKDVKQIDRLAKIIRSQNIKIAPRAKRESTKKKEEPAKKAPKRDLGEVYNTKNKKKEVEETKEQVVLTALMNKSKDAIQKFGFLPPSAILMRDSKAFAVIKMEFNDYDEKLEAFKELRDRINQDKADAVITINDAFMRVYKHEETDAPGREPGRDPLKKKEAIIIKLERRNDNKSYTLIAPYSRDESAKDGIGIQFEQTEFFESPLGDGGNLENLFG